MTYYTDSKVVLGYLQNDSRRFYVYVANRVQLIRRLSAQSQWRYIDTTQNPADLATRRLTASNLMDSDWLKGPHFLRSLDILQPEQDNFPLDANDPEVRREISTCATLAETLHGLGTERFTCFSSLSSLQCAIANLIVVARKFRRRKDQGKLHTPTTESRLRNPTLPELEQAMRVILQAIQEEVFDEMSKSKNRVHTSEEEIPCDRASEEKRTTKRSALFRLDLFVSADGLLRVRGRLRRTRLEYGERPRAIT